MVTCADVNKDGCRCSHTSYDLCVIHQDDTYIYQISQLIPPVSLLVSRRGFSRVWKPGEEPVGSGWSRRQSTMDSLIMLIITFTIYYIMYM